MNSKIIRSVAEKIESENGHKRFPFKNKFISYCTFHAVLALAFSGSITASLAATTSLQIASGLTNPNSGLILNGTAINPATQLPYRHLWVPDHLAGICRMDPDVDSPPVAPNTVPVFTINKQSCVNFVAGAALKPGQLAYDPITQDVYTVDLSAKSQGLFRLHYVPGSGTGSSDVGHGAFNLTQMEVLGGLNAGCGIGGKVPNSANLGPDGNLYIGFKGSGSIIRVVDPSREPLPCGNVQTIGTTGDQRKNFGLGWIGHDLYGADGLSPWVMRNADQCFTATNGNTTCHATSIFAGLIPIPSAIVSDQRYPAVDGSTLYMGTANSVAKAVIPQPSSTSFPSLDTSWATGFSFVTGLIVDTANPSNPVVYAADDPSRGLLVNSARLWRVDAPPLTPAVPNAPSSVIGVGQDGAVTVNWVSGTNGSQPISSFTVNTFAAGAFTPTTKIVSIVAPASTPPSSTIISGLTNGTSYTFSVLANNSVGSSAVSALSAQVTPQAAVVPSAPTNVSALAGDGSASLAWTPPVSNGGSTLISYTINTISATPSAAVPPAIQNIPGTTTGTVVNGLSNNASYTFTVQAINAKGAGPASAASNAIQPLAAVGNPDMGIVMTGASSVNFGSNVTYTLTATNNGPTAAAQVIVTDLLPAANATLVGVPVPGQGTCVASTTSVTCNLGAMPVGASVLIPVTLNITGSATNTAKVQANDAAGVVLTDPSPSNNSFSIATNVAVATTTTDLQLNGSAQNGGPPVGTADTYTWQIKNVGRDTANGVVFTNTLPATLKFSTANASLGSCNPPTAGGTISCSVSSLAAGQLMNITVGVIVGQTPGSISNTGSVTFNGTDINLSNNTATVIIQAK